jgi:type II secretory pathway pseudopilin PulG
MWSSGFTNNLGQTFITMQQSKYAVWLAPVVKTKARKATSTLELLVSIVIIAMSMAILMPALRKARMKAVAVQCMDNQRKIVIAVSAFATDNNGEYPESVATIGMLDEHWNWQEPTMLTAYRSPSLQQHRSLSAYLYSYIQDTSIITCPSAPKKNKFLQQAWDAGDDWDNPGTPSPQDPVMGTYCFYWNYTGFLEGRPYPFKGPQSISCEAGLSELLVSDYFGFGHWRNKFIYGDYKAYGSCERFKAASITPGTPVSSAFWSCRADEATPGYAPASNANKLRSFDIELHAAYTDGHVECYLPLQTIVMKVSQTPDGSAAYPADLGPGDFYLPENALP